MKRRLENITDQKIKRSKSAAPPKGTKTHAKIVSVYDGDTCDLVIAQNNKLERHKCRLADINAPELKKGPKAEKSRDFLVWLGTGKYKAPSRFSEEAAPLSKEQLQYKLDSNKSLVHAEFHGTGRYKRPLVTLKKTETSRKTFNDLLMEKGYAKPYRKKK